MEGKSIIKKYAKEELTIVWEPKKCIHAAVCVKELPGVYDPNAKPWIKPENASVDQLKSQIDKCPSGALSYEQKGITNQNKNMNTEVELMKNGPLLVYGSLKVTNNLKVAVPPSVIVEALIPLNVTVAAANSSPNSTAPL